MPAAANTQQSYTGRIGFYLNIIVIIVRTLAVLTFLGTGVAGGYGIFFANIRYTDAQSRIDNPNQTFTCNVSPCPNPYDDQQYARFQGLMGIYYCLFGLIGVLAEIRIQFLLNTVLRPFGFLHTWIGRGCFLIFIGTIFVMIPWTDPKDASNKNIGIIVGSFEIGVGAMEILVSLILGKDRKRFLPGKAAQRSDGVKAWPDSATGGAASETRAADGFALSPAKASKAGDAGTVTSGFSNPFRGGDSTNLLPVGREASTGAASTATAPEENGKTADASAAPVSTYTAPDGATVTKNPFNV